MYLSFNRRSALKLTTALGVMGAGSLVERAQAVGEFAVGCDEANTAASAMFQNPAKFAHGLDSHFASISMADFKDSPFATIEPRLYAELCESRERFFRLHPQFDSDGLNEFVEFEEACFNYAVCCYSKGVEHGAIYENLRLALAGEMAR